jgi:hypothetical protein
MITQYKIKLSSFTAELSEPLDRNARTLITTEADIYEESELDNNDGNYTKVYKAKVNGSTIVKQGDKKPILAKSKRTSSQKLRQAIWCINPDEDFYELIMSKITANIEKIIEDLN